MENPAVFGPYQLHDRLGSGAMGVVWSATGPEGSVAIKLIPEHLLADGAIKARLAREATAAGKIVHPGVVRIFGFREYDGKAGLVMELLAGETLADRLLREKALPPAEVERIAVTMAETLAFVHRRKIVHRDLKPDNIFLTSDGQVKLIDLGVAKVIDEASLTMTGSHFGTPAYMAPESFRDAKQVTAAADLWSLGVILYELATGQLPFPGTSAASIIAKVADPRVSPPSPTLIRPDLPEKLVRVIGQCLERDPRQRITAKQLAFALTGRQPVTRSRFWTGLITTIVRGAERAFRTLAWVRAHRLRSFLLVLVAVGVIYAFFPRLGVGIIILAHLMVLGYGFFRGAVWFFRRLALHRWSPERLTLVMAGGIVIVCLIGGVVMFGVGLVALSASSGANPVESLLSLGAPMAASALPVTRLQLDRESPLELTLDMGLRTTVKPWSSARIESASDTTLLARIEHCSGHTLLGIRQTKPGDPLYLGLARDDEGSPFPPKYRHTSLTTGSTTDSIRQVRTENVIALWTPVRKRVTGMPYQVRLTTELEVAENAATHLHQRPLLGQQPIVEIQPVSAWRALLEIEGETVEARVYDMDACGNVCALDYWALEQLDWQVPVTTPFRRGEREIRLRVRNHNLYATLTAIAPAPDPVAEYDLWVNTFSKLAVSLTHRPEPTAPGDTVWQAQLRLAGAPAVLTVVDADTDGVLSAGDRWSVSTRAAEPGWEPLTGRVPLLAMGESLTIWGRVLKVADPDAGKVTLTIGGGQP